jgi:uncharacterized protein with gpF-like domain
MISIPLGVSFAAFAADAQLPLATVAPLRKRGRQQSLKVTWPSAAIEAEYKKRLVKLLNEMSRSVIYWVTAARRKQEPAVVTLAMDDSASFTLARAMRELRRLWYRRFDAAAKKLAKYFALSAARRTDEALKKILRDAGMSIEFKMTAAQRDVLNAVIHENVALIKTIPRKYLAQVEGQVMRSVVAGRDLKSLTDELHQTFYASKKYAAFVARDQNNKVTGALQKVRFLESKIDEAEWMHSHAGREPRPNHVKFGRERKRFSVAQGMWDPDANGKGKGAWIWPGQLISCRCSCRPVVKGFEAS